MGRASHRQRAKVSRMMWAMLRRAARQNIDLEDDPLGSLYEVNRHNIRADHSDRGWLNSVREKLIDHLQTEGWTEVPTEWDYRLKSPVNDVEVTIGKVWTKPVGGHRFDVGVW